MKVEIKVRMLTAGNRSLYLEYYETGLLAKEKTCTCYLVTPDERPMQGNSTSRPTERRRRYRRSASLPLRHSRRSKRRKKTKRPRP